MVQILLLELKSLVVVQALLALAVLKNQMIKRVKKLLRIKNL
jgi:hypothetical protein